MSTDPVLTDANTAGSFNRYTYANNSPYKYIDPDGRDPGDPFKTAKAAAKDAIKFINPKSKQENREYGGEIYKGADGKYRAINPVPGSVDDVNPHDSPSPQGAAVKGDYHTHGEYSLKDPITGAVTVTADPKKDSFNSDKFSPGDRDGIKADAQGKPGYKGYLGTPSGRILEFDPKTEKTKEVK